MQTNCCSYFSSQGSHALLAALAFISAVYAYSLAAYVCGETLECQCVMYYVCASYPVIYCKTLWQLLSKEFANTMKCTGNLALE